MIKIKFVINTLNKNSTKSKLKEKQFAKKAKKAIENNDENTARVYARQSVQHKQMALKLLNLACRMEIMETNIQLQIQTSTISNDMIKIIGDLGKFCNPNMTIGNINLFESLFDDLTIASNVVSSTLDSSTASDVGASAEEDELINWAKDTHAHEQGNLPFLNLPTVNNVINNDREPFNNNQELF